MEKENKSDENLADQRDVFECFERFIDGFPAIKSDVFLWKYEIHGRDSRFLYSKNLLNILGFDSSDKDKLSKGLSHFIHEEDINDYQSRIENFLSSTDSTVLEHDYKIKKPDNSILYIQEKVIKSSDNGKLTLTGLSTDVTVYRRTFSTLTQKIENLKEQIFSRDKFLSILSHDLRAPFTSIIGFTEILLNDNSLSDKDRAEFLNYIQESATNQLEFVNYILDWSNLKLGRIKLNLQKVALADLIYNSISNLTGNSIRKNIEIKPQIDDSLHVRVDERLALQAITNLLNNSIKFTPEGKKIYIYSNRFNKNFVEIIIKDEGVGIPEEHRAKLFNLDNLFTQRGTKGEKGSGVGLSLVKEIVEKHGGQIWFYSKENQGTEFHFTFPSVEDVILVVEPDNNIASQIGKILSENFWMFKTICCTTAYKALEVTLESIPTLIILNPELELMDGEEFLESIFKIQPNFNNPIILLLNDNSSESKYRDYGIKTFIYKPINFDMLTTAISDILCSKYH
jgi:signal transduction histidine kinase